MSVKLTKEQNAMLVEWGEMLDVLAYFPFMSEEEVGRDYDLDKAGVMGVVDNVREIGIPFPEQVGVSKFDQWAIWQLHRAGKSAKEIAEAFGMDKPTMVYVITRKMDERAELEAAFAEYLEASDYDPDAVEDEPEEETVEEPPVIEHVEQEDAAPQPRTNVTQQSKSNGYRNGSRTAYSSQNGSQSSYRTPRRSHGSSAMS